MLAGQLSKSTQPGSVNTSTSPARGRQTWNSTKVRCNGFAHRWSSPGKKVTAMGSVSQEYCWSCKDREGQKGFLSGPSTARTQLLSKQDGPNSRPTKSSRLSEFLLKCQQVSSSPSLLPTFSSSYQQLYSSGSSLHIFPGTQIPAGPGLAINSCLFLFPDSRESILSLILPPNFMHSPWSHL